MPIVVQSSRALASARSTPSRLLVLSRSRRCCMRSRGVAVWLSWLHPYCRATVPVSLNMSKPSPMYRASGSCSHALRARNPVTPMNLSHAALVFTPGMRLHVLRKLCRLLSARSPLDLTESVGTSSVDLSVAVAASPPSPSPPSWPANETPLSLSVSGSATVGLNSGSFGSWSGGTWWRSCLWRAVRSACERVTDQLVIADWTSSGV
mmetsp:Transcript_32280/g.74607  ORF Transcript_32280/g.74607 Transcript_32280/m.74607 type:complete len:207 (-) Transcript_32280:57-677(-)